jgi:hypothetical protein
MIFNGWFELGSCSVIMASLHGDELRDRGTMSLQRYFILKGMLRIKMIILT